MNIKIPARALLLAAISAPTVALAQPVAAPNSVSSAAPGAVPNSVPVGGMMGQEGLNATAWVQTAAEWKIAARQAYFLATRQLDAALRNPKWNAVAEHAPSPHLLPELPAAVILDLDETVLDNSAYQARLVRDDAPFTPQSWGDWVAQADAKAIPGARNFLDFAQRKGVKIFYITNRTKAEEAATRQNLKRLGLPLQGPEDHVLTLGERPTWTSDKITRRRFVAKNHRVLLLVGDDLNDFITAKPRSLQERLDLLEKHAASWGQKWILLSNPLYGSWEGALFGYKNDLSRQQMLKRKYGALQTREPASRGKHRR